jgi:hypothetical protein
MTTPTEGFPVRADGGCLFCDTDAGQKHNEKCFLFNRKIVFSLEYPPIPIRSFDWCCYEYGADESDSFGWGATKQEALFDLKNNSES